MVGRDGVVAEVKFGRLIAKAVGVVVVAAWWWCG